MINSRIGPIFVRILFLVTLPLINIIHTALNNYRGNVNILRTYIDNIIPFEKIFIVPYLLWFFYFVSILVYFAIVDKKYYFRLLFSILVGNLLCFVVYYFYPTTVPRPDVIGNDILSYLVKLTYKSDNPFNCFPSVHVLNALLASMYLFNYNKKIAVRSFSVIAFVLITLSTLFVKQHYILDAVASSIIGVSMYVVFTSDYIWSTLYMKRMLYFFIPGLAKKDYAKVD
ncbi:MAG TPA: phosphatase PAP2 family protein [Pseudobacteroides sp.]|uniref:phosphatase PAP2 family protein n=1 Tax=Pseudobacteroides sp. TaxID=1968840 RepID=UPI002F949E9C